MSAPELEVLVRGRGGGKSTVAMRWVADGKRVRGYPGWSRVLVVANRSMFDCLRRDWWSQLEDFDHRVYVFKEWRRAHGVNPDTEVRLDNAEWLLPLMPGRLTGVTMSGAAWDAP